MNIYQTNIFSDLATTGCFLLTQKHFSRNPSSDIHFWETLTSRLRLS